MLCRVADDLFWMSRDVERAIFTGRLIEVAAHLELDAGAMGTSALGFWEMLLPRHAAHLGHRGDSTAIRQYLVLDPENSNSLIACLRRARANARGVRESLSSEMWEQINRLYLTLTDLGLEAEEHDDATSFYARVRDDAQFFQGLADSTLSRDEPWQFITVAKYLERADNVTRVVSAQAPFLALGDEELDATVRWLAVLRCCGCAEAYARHYTMRVEPARILEFLLLNSLFPQSARFSIAQASEALSAIARLNPGIARAGDRPLRTLGRLRALLDNTAVDEILEDGLTDFLREIREQIAEATDQIREMYFQEAPLDSSEPAAQRAAVIMAAQQQQQ
jgi:uncharacterized alpha-E superfamily protein